MKQVIRRNRRRPRDRDEVSGHDGAEHGSHPPLADRTLALAQERESGLAPELEEIAEAARFPGENPSPVFRVAADGRLLYANRASQSLMTAWGVGSGGCVPAPWRERIPEVFAAGEARKWDTQCDDRVLQLHCVPILAGGYVNVYGADVTERAALLAQLAEQARLAEQRAAELEATLDAISDGVVMLGPDGKIVRQNASAARLLGYQASDLDLPVEERGTRLAAELVSDPTANPDRLPGARAIRGETVRGELIRLWPLDGTGNESRYVLVSAAPVRDREGTPLGAVASFTDVTELRGTRDQLADRVEELEALLELLPVGIAISYDPECKDIRANPAEAKALGTAPDANVSLGADESRDRPPYRVFDPAGRELPVEELPMQAAAAHGTEVRDMVIDILRADGVRLTLLSYATPLLGEAGKPRGAVAVFVDISALRAAELERERLLHELEARHRELETQAEEIRALNAGLEQRVQERTAELEAIFASVPDALYVADASGILRCNEAALQGFGCDSVEELKVKLPALAEKMQSRYANTGQPIPSTELGVVRALRGERAVLETVTRSPRTSQDQVHRVAVGPIVLNGQIVAAVVLTSDITEQKRLQMELGYQANLLANVNDAIIAYDADLRVTAWNQKAEEQYGWTAEEAIGANALHIVGTQMTGEERAVVSRSLRETGQWRGEIRHTRRDGTPLTVEATTMALRDEAGQVYGFVTVNRDITRRIEAEAQRARLLEQLEASRQQLQALSRRFVTMQESERSYVADQLYNQAGQILAALQMQLSRLGREGGRESAAEQLPAMQAMLQEAMGKLHDLAKELRPVGLDRSTLARVLGAYATDFGKAYGLAIQFRPGAAETLRVPADVGTAIFRCMQEGLTNVALHARASEVVLSLTVDGDDLVVTLADNGVGFAARDTWDEDDPRLAKGLGLASMRERLEMVGGQLAILSGESGTTLTMQAPLGPGPWWRSSM
jgi:PAS domain S-box-containing protein